MMIQVAAGILIAAGIIGAFALGAAAWTHDSRNRSPTGGSVVMLAAVGAALAVIYIAA